MAERATAQAVALSRLGRRSRVATDPRPCQRLR